MPLKYLKQNTKSQLPLHTINKQHKLTHSKQNCDLLQTDARTPQRLSINYAWTKAPVEGGGLQGIHHRICIDTKNEETRFDFSICLA